MRKEFNISLKSTVILAVLVIVITVVLMAIMQTMIIFTKAELQEERFKVSAEMVDIRCREIEQTAEDWDRQYDMYVKRLSLFVAEIDSIPFTFAALYDKDFNVLSERFYYINISDDPLDPLVFPEVVALMCTQTTGIANVEYPVTLHNGDSKQRMMRVYFHRIPQAEENYLYVCIAQPFDYSLIDLPSHFLRLIYVIVGITGASICLFVGLLYRRFRQRFDRKDS